MPYARKGAETAEASAKSGNFPGRVPYLRLKDGDPEVFVRMIDDQRDWVNADVHPAIPTKEAPKNYKGKWPALMSATCQNDEMFKLHDEEGNPLEEYEPDMGQCYIHANYGKVLDRYDKPKSTPAPMVFALCVLREPVRNDAGAIVRMKDVTEEWTDPKTNNKRKVPAFRIISQRWGNFFSPMKAGAFLDNTVTNKDWRIERAGNDYHIAPLPPTADHAPGTPSWKTYEDAIALMKIDVFALVVEQGSVKHYQRFFIPGDHGDDEDGGSGEHYTDQEAGAEVSPEEMDAVRQAIQDRLMGGQVGSSS